jgi:PKD repeat protein/Tol biopolymer transport system component
MFTRRLCIALAGAALIAAAPAHALAPKPHLIVHGSGSAVSGLNGLASPTSISADGTYAIVVSSATDALPGFADHNGTGTDIYRVNLHTGQVELVSQSVAGGANGGNGASEEATVSPSGRFVAFTSAATDLVPGFVDHNGANGDIFMRDMDTGQTVLVTHKAALTTHGANANSYLVVLHWSSDSRYLFLISFATDLVSGQVDAAGTGDVFRYDRLTGASTLVTATTASPTTAGGFGDNVSMSADGTHAAFDAPSTAYVSPFTDNNGAGGWDVYERDVSAGTTTLVSGAGGSASAGANGGCSGGPTNADGGAVGFACDGTNLVAGFVDHNGASADAYMHVSSGATTLLSGAVGSSTQGANDAAWVQYLSDDRSFAVVGSPATNLVPGFVDGNGADPDVFIRDIAAGGTRLLTASTAGPTHGAGKDSGFAAASADGHTLFVYSPATDLTPGFSGSATQTELYRYDVAGGSASLVSGIGSTQGNEATFGAFPSADGSTVLFESPSTNLLPGFLNANGAASDAFASYAVAPTAKAAARATAPLTAAFDAAESADLDGTIANYAWTFGDGQTGTGVTPSHVYAHGGTYTATLTVTDDSGNTAAATSSVTVKPAIPHVGLKLGGARTQRLGRKGRLTVTAKCDVKCRLGVSGTLTRGFGKLKRPRTATVKARTTVVLTLHVAKRKRPGIRIALRRGKHVTAKLRVKAAATGYAATIKRRSVKLKR